MIRKPYIGKPVITGDPKCCDSLHKKGTLGVIVKINNIDCLLIKDKNGKTWRHCRKCLSPIKRVKKHTHSCSTCEYKRTGFDCHPCDVCVNNVTMHGTRKMYRIQQRK